MSFKCYLWMLGPEQFTPESPFLPSFLRWGWSGKTLPYVSRDLDKYVLVDRQIDHQRTRDGKKPSKIIPVIGSVQHIS